MSATSLAATRSAKDVFCVDWLSKISAALDWLIRTRAVERYSGVWSADHTAPASKSRLNTTSTTHSLRRSSSM